MRFDRQVLYLVFLFCTTHALPATRTNSSLSTQTTTTASLDDSPSNLSLDISPQLVSSIVDFASQVVSAVFAEESSSTNSRTRSRRLSSTRHVLDDTTASSSSESYPPVALHTTTRIAAPSNPRDPAVTTSSESTSTRSRTRPASSPATASVSSYSISARPTNSRGRSQASSHTAEDQDTSRHHTTSRPRPTATNAAGAQALNSSSSRNSSMNLESEVANMTGATNTVALVGGILTAISQVGALSGTNPASTTDLRPATATEDTEPENALDVLISALPSSVAVSIQSQYSDIIDPINSGINSLTNGLFGGSDQTTSRTQVPPITTSRSTRPRPTTSSSSPPTTSTSPSSTTTSTSSPPAETATNTAEDPTMITRPTSTPDPNVPADAATTTSSSSSTPGSSAANPSRNATTIGVATGISSIAFLALALGGLFLYRRKQQGKSPFVRKPSNRVYPEVAWLYDPDITPSHSRPGSRSGSGSGAQLIPAPRPGSVEIGGTPVYGGGGGGTPLLGGQSPEMRPAPGSGSPLLAPVVRASRDMVGSRSRSGSEVEWDVERLRPLSTLREEGTPRGSTS